MKHIDEIHTPAVLVEAGALERNIQNMQAACNAGRVELWPHCKTHKLVPVLKRQLAAGATGATCAKLGEAEALLPSGVKRVFIAHSLPASLIGSRLKRVAGEVDELILAVTSTAYFEVLEALLVKEDLRLPVLMAVDTGLNREGVRTLEEAKALAARIAQSKRMEFRGIYTHEGQTYFDPTKSLDELAAGVIRQMEAFKEAIGGEVLLWPGCSVTAAKIAATGKVHAVRPGAYVFGDLYLSEVFHTMPRKDAAISVLTTVVDRPSADIALIDAGSKVFSPDKTPEGVHAEVNDQSRHKITRFSEEHGFISGISDSNLKIGTRLRCTPAHVCPVLNLASHVYLVDGDKVLEEWAVDARGRST